MRYALCFVSVCVLVLAAACGGGEQASPTPEPIVMPTADNNPVSPQIDELLNPNPDVQAEGVSGTEEFELEVPLPGTLVASATEDPGAGTSFDKISFVMQGGPNKTTLVINVTGDGKVVRNGVTGTVSPGQISEINNMIDELNFFGVQGTFLGPTNDDNAYTYMVTVDRGYSSRMINAQDGYIPQEMKSFLAKLSELGAPTGPGG